MPEQTAIAEREPSREIAAVPRQSDNLLAQVIAAAKDPSIDATKMETLARLVNTQQDRERAIEFNRDLNAAMMEMPVISKEGRIIITDKNDRTRIIQSTKFAKFEDIDRVCRPILRAHNLAVRFEVGEENQKVSVRPLICHSNGHTERGEAMTAVLDTSGSKNNVQGAGSTVSYLKRYTYCAALNIITEGVDDDANGGRGEVVTLPNEREQLVLTEARAAFEAGRYAEHFAGLGPKDRAWLMQSGHHQEFGGQVALPSSNAKPAQPKQEARREPDPPPAAEEPAKPLTARQWTDKFKTDVGACGDLDALDLYMDEAREALDRLKGASEARWQECQDAYLTRKQQIETGALL